jgi:hypothetical protein
MRDIIAICGSRVLVGVKRIEGFAALSFAVHIASNHLTLLEPSIGLFADGGGLRHVKPGRKRPIVFIKLDPDLTAAPVNDNAASHRAHI